MLVRRKKIYRKREFLPVFAVKVFGISRITNKQMSAKKKHTAQWIFQNSFCQHTTNRRG